MFETSSPPEVEPLSEKSQLIAEVESNNRKISQTKQKLDGLELQIIDIGD